MLWHWWISWSSGNTGLLLLCLDRSIASEAWAVWTGAEKQALLSQLEEDLIQLEGTLHRYLLVQLHPQLHEVATTKVHRFVDKFVTPPPSTNVREPFANYFCKLPSTTEHWPTVLQLTFSQMIFINFHSLDVPYQPIPILSWPSFLETFSLNLALLASYTLNCNLTIFFMLLVERLHIPYQERLWWLQASTDLYWTNWWLLTAIEELWSNLSYNISSCYIWSRWMKYDCHTLSGQSMVAIHFPPGPKMIAIFCPLCNYFVPYS